MSTREAAATLSATRVRDILKACLYTDDEWPGELSRDAAPEGAVFVEGIVNSYAFHPVRIADHRAEIGALLAELPEEFQAKGGGGWSFLNACMDRHGTHWAEHPTIEALVCLGIATGQARWLMKELAAVLPGGLPYFIVGDSSL